MLLRTGAIPVSLHFKTKVRLNFAAVYLIWGSTYMAIKHGVADIPPFLMASIRYFAASLILLGLSRFRKENALSASDFKIASLSGILLVLGNALVCFSEEVLPSGLVAVIVGTMPVWITLINWYFFRGSRPKLRQFLGITMALSGILFLMSSQSTLFVTNDYLHYFALGCSLIIWAVGTLVQRKSSKETPLLAFSGLQLGVGALFLFALWWFVQGPQSFEWARLQASSVLAVLYLCLFGSVLASTSYLWLNRNVDPTVVSTYALVNPVVAVWLGWIFMGEHVGALTLLYSSVVIVGLYFVLIKPGFGKRLRFRFLEAGFIRSRTHVLEKKSVSLD